MTTHELLDQVPLDNFQKHLIQILQTLCTSLENIGKRFLIIRCNVVRRSITNSDSVQMTGFDAKHVETHPNAYHVIISFR